MTHAGEGPDHHFPVAHIRPPKGWVNDPNGPIRHRGRYHLFFQYTREVPPKMTEVVWAHSSSPDLAFWEIHGIALAPSSEHPGVEGFWSGNTVEHEGRLVAFYADYRRSERYQPPRMAVSDDAGMSFGEDMPVVPPPEEAEGAEIFRDPFVWYEDGRWRLLMGSGLADGTAAQVRLYESDDLRSWKNLGVFAALKGDKGAPDDPGMAWECPQYAWGLGVLFVGTWRPDVGTMNVLAIKGSEQDGQLVVHGVEPADRARLLCAFHHADARRPVPAVGRRKGGKGPDVARRGRLGGDAFAAPEVSLEAGRLVSKPARELEALRGELCHEYQGKSAEVGFGEVPRAFELRLRLAPSPATATLVLDLGGGEVHSVRVDATAGEVIIDRSRASSDPHAHGGSITVAPADGLFASGHVELAWFVDHSISELFVGGTVVATTRLFPTSAGPWQLRLTTSDVCRARRRGCGLCDQAYVWRASWKRQNRRRPTGDRGARQEPPNCQGSPLGQGGTRWKSQADHGRRRTLHPGPIG